MPLKNCLKTSKFAILCVLAVMLSACIQPVDVGQFMENDIVEEQIEKNKVKVIISGDSDKGLTAENGKISGLDPNKYYKVEELDGSGNPVETNFVKVDGKLGSLGNIGKVKGREITGLINDVTYRVKSAVPFSSVSFSYKDGGATPIPDLTDANGKITIPAPTGTLTLEGLSPTYDGYDVMAVAVSPSTLSPAWSDKRTINASTTSFQLGGANTTVDYIFVKTTPTLGFKVLTVVIQAITVSISVNVSFASQTEATWSITPSGPITLSGSTTTANITLGGSFTNINWYLDGYVDGSNVPISLGTTAPLSLSWSDLTITKLISAGTYHLYVTAKDTDNKLYSSETTPLTVTIAAY